jgi:hypothetical protein
MKIFSCPECAQVVFFENQSCVRCGSLLAFVPERRAMLALESEPVDPAAASPRHRVRSREGSAAAGGLPAVSLCINRVRHGVCNGVVEDASTESLCSSCRFTKIVPDPGSPEVVEKWIRLEGAKRRLLYAFDTLGLDVRPLHEGEPGGLSFAFLQPSEGGARVVTGHADGLITVDLSEADEVHRTKTKSDLGEPYRTLLGHLRHESGHYFWDRLVRDDEHLLGAFRGRFGDERVDYAAALDRHYAQGAPAGWEQTHVSAYATMHPWEDWAETWAHYLHIVDTLETASAYGLALQPHVVGGSPAEHLAVSDWSPSDFDDLYNAWVPVTMALNSFNRGMGLSDLYPFVLAAPAVEKLRFVHEVVRGAADAGGATAERSAS